MSNETIQASMVNSTVHTQFTFGNYLVTAKLTPEVLSGAKLANLPLGYILDGITQKLQRKPASAVEKALAGYVKRPTGFKRDSIAFSAKGVSLLELEMGAAVKDVAEVSVKQYVPTQADAKYTYEKGLLAERIAGGVTLDSIVEKMGFEGEVEGENDGYSIEFLTACRARVEAARKSSL